jgi:lipoprotein-releasing system ATP-binding protein
MSDTPPPIIRATNLHRTFREGDRQLHVLQGVDVDVRSGEWLAILGRSGSGKSTLLHLLGGLDRPTDGRVLFDGRDVYTWSELDIDRYRATRVGFVFQFYHLLPELSALENVLIGGMVTRSIGGWLGQRRAMRQRAEDLLDELGLKERMRHRPGQLSGGERQRVAIARALMNEPAVLLADEPTGNLDAETAARTLDAFRLLHRKGQTMVLVTHDATVAAAADRQLTLVRGRLVIHGAGLASDPTAAGA